MAGGERLVAAPGWLVCGGWSLELVVGGCRLVVGGYWLVVGEQSRVSGLWVGGAVGV